jgi:hypothetical protein
MKTDTLPPGYPPSDATTPPLLVAEADGLRFTVFASGRALVTLLPRKKPRLRKPKP